MKKRIKQVVLVAMITYILMELMCYIVVKTKYIPAELPSFFTDPKDTLLFPFTRADINPYWGSWHYNFPVKMPYGCITTECFPNSVGARDKERTLTSKDTNRVIILGDSFIEGFGVNTEERLSDLLEKKTGYEFMNFGCADMGSTQEYMVYKHLASNYSHNTVLVGILPCNDFLNDDIAFDSIQKPLRYKPYWTGLFPEMNINYYVKDIRDSQFNQEAFKMYKSTYKYKLRHFLENTTCWFNILYFLSKKAPAANFVKNKTREKRPYSGYYDYTQQELLRLQQSLLCIKRLGEGKRIIIFTIPVEHDYSKYVTDKNPPLPAALQQFSREQDLEYVDLLTSSTDSEINNCKTFYFGCDEHWNAAGNIFAFKKLLPLFK